MALPTVTHALDTISKRTALREYLARLVTALETRSAGASVIRASKAAADGSAGAATAEFIVPRAPVAGAVTSLAFKASSGGLTSDDTNNAVITLKKRAADGTATTIVAVTTNTTSGNWTQWVSKALAVAADLSSATLLATDELTLTIAKGGTGVAAPAGVWSIGFTPTT